jgi:hypothetical protein
MALTDDNGGTNTTMLVQPSGFGGYGNNGGFFGGDWAWILLLLLIGGNGWGFGGFGGMGGMMWPMMMGGMGAGFGLDYLYPWLNNSQHISDGFRDQNLQTSINGLQNTVTAGFGDVQNALCSGFGGVNMNLSNGFAGVNATINGAQNALAQQMYTNQISDLERSYAAQTANTAGLNAVQAQLAQCCCDNRAATADVKYTIATEACASRANSTANTQLILDKLCALELDNAKNQIAAEQRENANLRTELMYARGQASQVEQTARILAGQAAEIDGVYNRLKNCPVNTVPVFGNQPIFTCGSNVAGTNFGCGCGA